MPSSPEPTRDEVVPLERAELAQASLEVAPRLLNALICAGGRIGRIVEVEAYAGADDPASHAYRGRTARNATMFEGPGRLYTYLSYGMHICANVTCGAVGRASAVLIRAIAPVAGIPAMRDGRPERLADALLGSGPGRACRSLGITLADDGSDLCARGSHLVLARDGVAAPRSPLVGPRVGLSARCGDALHWPWRFAVPGERAVSRPLPPEAIRRPA
ncbi:MAG: DNA-3-methyladenine glycosylase [Actinomycetota bacterium]|nr:DNA-3-methyladenine glycosylase [Actinomycetota bacterium]